MNTEDTSEEGKSSTPFESGSFPLGRLGGAAFLQRSDAAQEIISRKPGFIEKWALVLFMGILLLLIGGTWFIKYPEIIEARGTLTADNAPKEIVSLQTGRLIKLFVKNGLPVKSDDMIAWLESTADTREVLHLSTLLDSSLVLLAAGRSENLSDLFKAGYQKLGELQAPYQIFSTALQQYNDYLVNGFYSRSIQLDNGLETNLKNNIQYKNGLKAQAIIITKNMRLLERLYYNIVKATSPGK